MTALLLSQVLTEQRSGKHVVALRGDERLTLDQLRRDVGIARLRIRERGVRRAALVCRDAYWFAVGLFGLFAAGAEAVIPPNSQPGVLRALAGEYDVVLGDDAALSDFILGANRAGPVYAEPLPADDCVLRIFTSGSTGAPKCVRKTLGQFEQEARLLGRRWDGELGEAPVFATVSHQHVYGLTFRLLWPLAAGRPFIATTFATWEEVIAQLPAAAVLISSPTHLLRLSGLAPLMPAARPRLVFTAGAPLPASAAREVLHILGVLPTEIYGSTETGALATRQQDSADVPWRPLPGVAISADDGRLCVRSPSVDPHASLTMEDMIEIRPDGGFELLGRVDRVVKIEGKRVSLPEVERLLLASPLVGDAAAIALDCSPTILVAAVVPSAEGRVKLAAEGAFRFSRRLRRRLLEHLDPAALPRRWRFVDAIPSAALGKRPRSVIAALFEASGNG